MRTKCFIPLLALSLLISACDDEINPTAEMGPTGITVEAISKVLNAY